MKRRGFLGFLAGAAVAGPGVVKDAAAQTLGDLELNSPGLTPDWLHEGLGDTYPASDDSNYLEGKAMQLAKLVARPDYLHDYHRLRTDVHAIDADLGSMRSVALWHKVRTQRNRNYEREIESQRGWLEGTIAGWFR